MSTWDLNFKSSKALSPTRFLNFHFTIKSEKSLAAPSFSFTLVTMAERSDIKAAETNRTSPFPKRG
jgi:hypothetical protein